MTGGALTIKTNIAKEIDIKWAQVAGMDTKTPRRAKLATGDDAVVTFKRAGDGGFTMSSPGTGGSRAVNSADIKKYAFSEHPQWVVSLGAFLSGSGGNSDVQNYGFDGDALRESDVDRLRLTGRATQQVKDSKTLTQQVLTRASYDYFFHPRWFWGGFVEFQHDKFQDLRLRTRVGGGPGYYFNKEDGFYWMGQIGAAYVLEDYFRGKDRDFISAVISEESERRWSRKQWFYQRVDVYPSLQSVKDVSLQFKIAYRYLLTTHSFAELSFIDLFKNKPSAGKQKNDYQYGLTIGVTY
jgi:hypothetical protein